MLVAGLHQSGDWQFDLPSAIIGAIVAWVIAGLIYARRKQIRQTVKRLWEPVANFRRHLQSSQEEKYLKALQGALKSLLLFTPRQPELIFQPPSFSLLSDAPESQDLNAIPYTTLLDGHSQILILGTVGSGRTTALAMLVWQLAQTAEDDQPFKRFPVWMDLEKLKDLPEKDSPPLERLAQLASLFLPEVTTKWLISQLRREPSLILIDNWDSLAPDERSLMALWIHEITLELPDSVWVMTSQEEGYGPLVEVGFTPVRLIPNTGDEAITALYRGWATLKDHEETEPTEDVSNALHWAGVAGASLMELNLRTILYLNTGQLPVRPVDVMDYLLDYRIPKIDLGEDQEEVGDLARQLTLDTLTHVARTRRMEGLAVTRDQLNEFVASRLPPAEERPPKLEGAVRKLLGDAKLLHRSGKSLLLEHYVWEAFLGAWALATEENGAMFVEEHLDDPMWALLIEYYTGIADVLPLIESTLQKAKDTWDDELFLRVARWATFAQEDAPWQKAVIKALAQNFMDQEISKPMRLRIGRAIALIAGDSARAFFLQALRHPDLAVRAVALRGLGWTGTSREMAILGRALMDKHVEIQQSAVQALADMGTLGAVKLLRQTLMQAEEELMLHIAEAMAHIPEGHKLLQEASEHTDLLIRRAACYGLGLIDQSWAHEKLTQIARDDPEWLVRSAANVALNAHKERQAVTTTVPAPPEIDQLDWLINWTAQQGVGLGIGDAAFDMLRRAAVEGDTEVQRASLELMATIGRKHDADILRPIALNAQDPTIRNIAQETIAQIERRYSVHQGNHTLEI